MKFSAYPLDVTYREVEGKTEIILFAKTEKGVCCFVEQYDPYFYVEVDSSSTKEKISSLKDDDCEVISVEDVEKNISGRPKNLLKITVNVPRAVPKIKDLIKDAVVETYETDILFARRYLIDKQITPLREVDIEATKEKEQFQRPTYRIKKIKEGETAIEDLDVLAIDIETYGKTMSMEKNPILMVALYGKNISRVITWKKVAGKNIEVVNNEKEMLERTKELLEEANPDILTGYFSDGFDLPYIEKRAKQYKIDFTYKGQPMKFSQGNETHARIEGLPHIDLLRLVKRTVGRGLETSQYSLDAVAQEVLGEKKHEVNLDNLSDDWDNEKDLEKYAAYNLHDTYLTYELFHKLLPQLEEFVNIIGLLPYDVCRMSFSQLVEWFIIKQTPNFNEIILNKPGHEEMMQRRAARLKGAFVHQPTPGLYKDVLVFDFMSLYPTIITAHNISLSSLREGNTEEGTVNPDDEGIWFSKKPGFLSTILKEVISTRLALKKKQKKNAFLEARIYALKILANSFYGYLAFSVARWYCFPCAETITAFARYYIKKVIKNMQDAGFDVIYSDTDSVFVATGKKKREDAMKVVEKINRDLPGMMELEYEGYYPSGLFVETKGKEGGAKKRYVLMDEKKKMKVTGFESVRRNVSPIAKEVQEHVFTYLLGEQDVEKAATYVKKIVNELKQGKVPVEKLTITTRISKDLKQYDAIGPHVAVARRMQEKGEKVGAGTMVRYVIGEGEGRIRDRASLPEETKTYDAEYYISHQVIPAVEKIFEVVGVEKEALLGEGSQSNLSKFF